MFNLGSGEISNLSLLGGIAGEDPSALIVLLALLFLGDSRLLSLVNQGRASRFEGYYLNLHWGHQSGVNLVAVFNERPIGQQGGQVEGAPGWVTLGHLRATWCPVYHGQLQVTSGFYECQDPRAEFSVSSSSRTVVSVAAW